MAQRQKNVHQGIPLPQTGCCTCCLLPAASSNSVYVSSGSLRHIFSH